MLSRLAQCISALGGRRGNEGCQELTLMGDVRRRWWVVGGHGVHDA